MRKQRRRRSFILSAAFGLLLAVPGGPVLAEDIPDASPQGAGLQAASWFVAVPYGAVKGAYAIGGGIVGSLAWVVTGGSTDAAKSLWIPSMTGDYIAAAASHRGEHLPLRGRVVHDSVSSSSLIGSQLRTAPRQLRAVIMPVGVLPFSRVKGGPMEPIVNLKEAAATSLGTRLVSEQACGHSCLMDDVRAGSGKPTGKVRCLECQAVIDDPYLGAK